jgi:hypothetical protein
MSNQFVVLCGCGCWEVGDPGVDPPDHIGNICTINGDLITNEKILCDICFDPFPKFMFLFHCPTTITYSPDLMRGFMDGFAKGWDRKEDEDKDDEKIHISYHYCTVKN